MERRRARFRFRGRSGVLGSKRSDQPMENFHWRRGGTPTMSMGASYFGSLSSRRRLSSRPSSAALLGGLSTEFVRGGGYRFPSFPRMGQCVEEVQRACLRVGVAARLFSSGGGGGSSSSGVFQRKTGLFSRRVLQSEPEHTAIPFPGFPQSWCEPGNGQRGRFFLFHTSLGGRRSPIEVVAPRPPRASWRQLIGLGGNASTDCPPEGVVVVVVVVATGWAGARTRKLCWIQ